MSDEPQTEDEWRAHVKSQGCTCDCVRILDYDRIEAAGGNPGNPNCVVFNHTFDCAYCRSIHAQWN